MLAPCNVSFCLDKIWVGDHLEGMGLHMHVDQLFWQIWSAKGPDVKRGAACRHFLCQLILGLNGKPHHHGGP